MSADSTFTMADAQSVLQIAESAAIPSMAHAKARADLLNRFAQWANLAFAAIEQTVQAAVGKPVESPTPPPSAPSVVTAG